MRKLFVLDEGVEIPSVPASASSKSRDRYPLVRVGTIEGNTVVSSVSRKENPVRGAVEPLRVYERQAVRQPASSFAYS